jgi:hypothetical protein
MAINRARVCGSLSRRKRCCSVPPADYITIAILHDVPSRSLGIGRSQGDTHAKQEVRNCRGGSPYCRHQVDTDLPSLRVLLSMIPSAVIRAMYNSPSNRGHWNCYYG